MSGKIINNDQYSSGKKTTLLSRLKAKKPLVIAILVLVILILIVSVSTYILDNRDKGSSVTQSQTLVCTNNPDLISVAVMNLAQEKASTLKVTIDSILQSDHYQDDQNCLFLLTRYYANINDVDNMRRYYNQFNSIYKKEFAVIKNNKTEYYFGIDSIRQYVEFVESSNNRDAENKKKMQHPNDR